MKRKCKFDHLSPLVASEEAIHAKGCHNLFRKGASPKWTLILTGECPGLYLKESGGGATPTHHSKVPSAKFLGQLRNRRRVLP